MPSFTTRPATEADSDWLYALHRATMRDYVEAVHGPWDDDVQFAFHQEWLRYSEPEVVLAAAEPGEQPVGVVDWAWRDHDLYVGRIEIAPERQSSGYGTSVLRHLADLAAARSQPVLLEVIDVNPARRLYERLGFRVVEVIERKVHLRLDPPPTAR